MRIKNKYELTEMLSEGSFGCVYKGYKIKNGQSVAVKINKTDINFLKQECTIMHYLLNNKCAAIPDIYYYGLLENYYIVVMKYCELSLNDFVKMYDYNLKIMKNLFFQCVELLQEMHENMVVHCDIKPDNIMISENRLYFIDFGLSQFYVNEDGVVPTTRHTQITGTPRYVSPFIHQGYSYSPRDDIISLCYVFYELQRSLPWDSNGFVNDIQHEKNKDMCIRKIRCARDEPENTYLAIIINVLKYCYTLDCDSSIDYKAIVQQI
jgi:serine/threonine protein kinase